MKNTIFVLLLTLNFQCIILNEAGLSPNGDIKGSLAKKILSDAILEAESSALSLYLSNGGMKGGITAIAPLIAINGFLASKLYPLTSKIEDQSYYSSQSVEKCEEDIKSKGAIVLGLGFSDLPPSGLAGPLRDSALLPEFASCDLKKSGKLISLPGGIQL